MRLINAAAAASTTRRRWSKGLKSGKLAGVALDVYAEEPCTDSPLFGMPGVLCTPHLGASTEEAQTQVAVEAVELLTDFLTTGAIRRAVNVPPVDPKTLESLRGYLDVAHRLGRMAAGLLPSGVTACHLHYRGEVCERDTKLLTSAFAAGLLENALAEDVNLVNAEMLLRERGIDVVVECRGDMGAFRSSIAVEVSAGGVTRQVVGTLFGNNMPRLVGLDDYRLEAFLDGCLLVFSHQDVPGIIGAIGSTLGEHGVNIAQMAVGRAGNLPGGQAVGVLNLDGEPPKQAIDAVLKLEAVSSATVVHLPPAGSLPSWLG